MWLFNWEKICSVPREGEKGCQRFQRNGCSIVTAGCNLITFKSAEKWVVCENVSLLGATLQGQGASLRVPTGAKPRSSWLFVSTSVPFKSLTDWPGIWSLWTQSSVCALTAWLSQKDMILYICRSVCVHGDMTYTVSYQPQHLKSCSLIGEISPS